MNMQHRGAFDGATIIASDRASEKQDKAIRATRIARSNTAAAAVHAADDSPWIVLRVMTGREVAVENALRNAGIECLVPMRKGRRLRRRGRMMQAVIPVMTGYVLVRFEMSVGAIVGVLGFEHVVGTVGSAEEPRLVSHCEVESFSQMAKNGQFDWSSLTTGIVRNCKVEALHGPFRGSKGVVMSSRSDGLGDAVVEFDVDGAKIPALVPLAILQKL